MGPQAEAAVRLAEVPNASGEASTALRKRQRARPRVERLSFARQDCLKGCAASLPQKLRVSPACLPCNGQVGTGPTFRFVVLLVFAESRARAQAPSASEGQKIHFSDSVERATTPSNTGYSGMGVRRNLGRERRVGYRSKFGREVAR